MVAESYNKKLNCRREKNTCYSVLGILFLLSAGMFGVSFAPSLRSTSTRVYLWVLSCSLFVISSSIVLFLFSFCNSCAGCHVEDGEARVPMPVQGQAEADMFEKDKSLSPSSTLTPHDDVPDLQKYYPRPIPPRDSRESVSSGNVLFNIEEEQQQQQRGSHGIRTTPFQYEIDDCAALMRPPTASLGRERRDLAPQSEMPYLQPDDYPEPDTGLAPPSIAPAATTGPDEERIWEFEKDWTTWTPARVAESRGSTN